MRRLQEIGSVALCPREVRQDFLREPGELLETDRRRGAHARADVDVLEPRIAVLEVFQGGDEAVGGAAEPGATTGEILEAGDAGRGPAAALGGRTDLALGNAGHEAEGGEHLHGSSNQGVISRSAR